MPPRQGRWQSFVANASNASRVSLGSCGRAIASSCIQLVQPAAACSRHAADSSLHLCESDGTPMANLFICRFCRVEMEAIALAGGSAVLVCVDCERVELKR